MSTVTEVKEATGHLSSKDRWELYVWLRESEDVLAHQREELRGELALGLEQSSRGEIAPFSISSIRTKIHHRLEQAPQS